MKIIEALKKVKSNKEKIADLQRKIQQHAAHLSHETPVYGSNQGVALSSWMQSCLDLSKDNVELLCRIQRTNLNTVVPVVVNGKTINKTIAEWVWRRREYAMLDAATMKCFSDRGLKEGQMPSSTGATIPVTIVRYYDPASRDAMLANYAEEHAAIAAALEIANATTDLV